MDYNPFTLKGRTFLITGAASGIGRQTSIELSKLGAKLVLCDINGDELQNTKKLCGADHYLLVTDLKETDSLKSKIYHAVKEYGKLNGFVHLAGIPYISPLKSLSKEKTLQVFNINSLAALELTKIFIDKNIYSGENGSVVLVSSVYGLVGSAANVVYAMSKSALHGLTKSLAIELARKGIRVNCVAPGFVKTNMLDEASSLFNAAYAETLKNLHPLGIGEPQDIALSIAYLLSDGAKWITGSILSVDGGFTAQ